MKNTTAFSFLILKMLNFGPFIVLLKITMVPYANYYCIFIVDS